MFEFINDHESTGFNFCVSRPSILVDGYGILFDLGEREVDEDLPPHQLHTWFI